LPAGERGIFEAGIDQKIRGVRERKAGEADRQA
jgi:hypothetical protein